MKISTRLILLLVAAVVSVMAVYALVTLSSTQARLDDEMHKMAEHIGLALSVGVLHHLEEGDVSGVSDVLETISRHEDIIGAAVFDADGTLVAASSTMVGEAVPEVQTGAHEQAVAAHPGMSGNANARYTYGIQNVRGEEVGRLKLVLREHSMLPHVLMVRNQVLVTIVVLTMVLSALVIYVSRKQIASPLAVLAEGADAIGRGELSRRIALNTGGELAELAGAFNRMAANLEMSNQKLADERERTQHAEKLAAVGQLAAGVAHEIGTPLNVISGSAEYLLMDAKPGDPSTEELRTIVLEVGRISDLVRRLMVFARQGKPKIEPVAIPELLESILVLLRRQMEKQGIAIQVDVPDDLPKIAGDRDQLQQVFLNLIMNAWQAMPDGGRLALSGSVVDGALKIAVSDTGTGIPKGDLKRIFEPFFTTKEVGKGTGLGLSIAHRIAEDHGGHITVSSGEGEGSVFEVYLPIEKGVAHD